MISRTSLPQRFEQLSARDQEAYKQLQNTFRRTLCHKDRHKNHIRMFTAIDYFVQKNKLRGLVCGFFKVSYNKLLINTKQLKILICNGKAQTNIILKKSGFLTLLERPHAEELEKYLGLHPKDPQSRCWSYRSVPQNVSAASLPVLQVQTQPDPDPEPPKVSEGTIITLDCVEKPSKDIEIHFPEPRPESELTPPGYYEPDYYEQFRAIEIDLS